MRSRFEKSSQKDLEKWGYMVDYKARVSRPMSGYNQDYWNLFDLLCFKEGEIRFISIKGKSCPAQHKRDLQQFSEIINCPCVSTELWRHDREPKNKNKIRRRITKYE